MDLKHFDWTTASAITDLGPAVIELAQRQWQVFLNSSRGKPSIYREILARLPTMPEATVASDQATVVIGNGEIDDTRRSSLLHGLKALLPWRKGPFTVYGIDIDTEWRSNLKWDRLSEQITPLTNRRVLDVGSSSGYYMFRMLASQPRWVLGLEPYWTYFCQFLVLNGYARSQSLAALPVKLEALPDIDSGVDTVFCMGVLYHHRRPMDPLSQLHRTLSRNGELILETLVIDATDAMVLRPANRYAKMPNVHLLPSIPLLVEWLSDAGFIDIHCAGISTTTVEEQRQTEWMPFESLSDFLDTDNPERTIEGHPAPRRAIMICKKR